MERETALQSYREAVSGKIADFRSNMEKHLVEHAEYLENIVRSGMELLGEQMKKQEKEYVCFLYSSVLKTDLIAGKYRIFSMVWTCDGIWMRSPRRRMWMRQNYLSRLNVCGIRWKRQTVVMAEP